MQIRRTDNGILMSSMLVCENYGNWSHAMDREFEKVSDNEYKCKGCGSIMVFKEPVLTLDDKGRLKMEVATEIK